MSVRIPLSKRSKTLAGKYETIISDEDAILASKNWYILSERKNSAYARGHIEGKPILLHRLVMERMLGYPLEPTQTVDHINHNKLDNRRENLRIVTKQQNMFNMEIRLNNKSGYKGVSWHKGVKKYVAQISINRKKLHLGYFNTPIEAHEAYKAKAIELFGEYAKY